MTRPTRAHPNSLAFHKNMVLISKLIGDFGHYQLFLCIIVFLSQFGVALHQMAITFLALPIHLPCVNQSCCEDPIYDKSKFTRTIVTEWNLVCDNSWLQELTQTMFQFGVMSGSLVFGIASDRYGRRPTLVFAVVLEVFSGIISSFLPTFWSFTSVRMVLGMSVGGIMVVGFVLVMEYTGEMYRCVISALFHVPFTLGFLFIVLFGYFIRDYVHFQLSISLVNMVLLFYICVLPESPRWLLVANKTAKAVELIEQIAKINQLPMEDIDRQIQMYRMEYLRNSDQKGSLLDLFRTPIRKHMSVMLFVWFACSYCFYGLIYYVNNLINNIYINILVSGSVCLCACLIAIPLITNINRKKLVIISNVIISLCFLLLSFVPKETTWSITISIIISCFGIFSNFILFVVLYLYCAEMFPTIIRSIAVGCTLMMARLGTMIAPYIVGLRAYSNWCTIAFGVFPIITAMLCFLLPDMKNCQFIMTIEDSQALCNNSRRNTATITQ